MFIVHLEGILREPAAATLSPSTPACTRVPCCRCQRILYTILKVGEENASLPLISNVHSFSVQCLYIVIKGKIFKSELDYFGAFGYAHAPATYRRHNVFVVIQQREAPQNPLERKS